MQPNQRIEFIVSTLIRFRKLWIIPAVAGVVLSLLYVFLLRGETWTARQSLIVRDDLLGQSFKPGQFNSLDSMKSAQETILEIARKPAVIRNVLKELGPRSKGLFSGSGYPDDATIEDVQGMISFSAPNGAEFGKTEVVVLNAKSSSPERAHQFIKLLMNEMEANISEVRQLRLHSMESELSLARDGAALSLEESMKKLQAMEAKLGPDVGTMNGLNSTQPSDGSGRQEIATIQSEKRAFQAQLDSALSAQNLLLEAKLDPQRMLATSADFLKSEPKLEALSKALVDAQKAYADNYGRYELEHPVIQRSLETIEIMREQIFLELENLTVSTQARISELKQRIARLDGLSDDQRDRLVELGTKRVDHLTINSEVTKKTEIYNLAQSRLSEVQALRASAGQISWMTRIGEPQLATRPDGLGKKATVMVGGICGLMLGLGLVMLFAPPIEGPLTGRPGRRSDGPRRISDNVDAKNESALTDQSEYERLTDSPDQHYPVAVRPRTDTPSLNEMVGPTAANAIQTATASINKSVAMAKNVINKHKNSATNNAADNSGSSAVNIPNVATNASGEKPKVSLRESLQSSAELKPKARTATNAPLPQFETESKLPNKHHNAETADENVFSNPEPAIETTSEQTVADNQQYETDPNVSAADILAELRANRAQQTAPKMAGTPIVSESSSSTKNQRPIDIARAAGQQSNLATSPDNATMQFDAFQFARNSFEIEQQISASQQATAMDNLEVTSVAKALTESSENPFLKHRTTNRSAEPVKPATPSEPSDVNKATVEVRSNSASARPNPSLPIPDQIRNLADSIANFPKPKR